MREVPLWSLCTCNDDTLPEDTDPDLQIKYIDISNVDSVNGISGFSSYNFSESPSRARRLAKVGDIIVSTVRTYLQAIALVDQKHADCVFSTGFAVLRPKDPRQSLAIYFALKSKIVNDRINIQSKGVAYPSITSTELMHIKVQLQKNVERLVKAASNINDIIYKKEKLIKALFEYRQSLITRAVTKGLDPNVPMKDSGIPSIGKIPEHWRFAKLARFATISTGKTPKGASEEYFEDGEINWATPEDISSCRLIDTKRKVNDRCLDHVPIFPRNTVFLVSIGASIGKTSIIEAPSSCNQQINAIQCRNSLNPQYLLYYLTAADKYIRNSSNSSTLPILNQQKTSQLYVSIPPIGEQLHIVENIELKLAKLERLIEHLNLSICSLTEYRSSVINSVISKI